MEKKPTSDTLIIRRIETKITVSTLYTSGPRVKNVNIIHKWLKCQNYTLLVIKSYRCHHYTEEVKRLNISILYTSG